MLKPTAFVPYFQIQMPSIERIGKSIQTWLVLQEKHNATVEHVAKVWNLDPKAVVAIVEIQPYLALEKHSGDDIRLWTIGHDDPK